MNVNSCFCSLILFIGAPLSLYLHNVRIKLKKNQNDRGLTISKLPFIITHPNFIPVGVQTLRVIYPIEANHIFYMRSI